jgi:threonine synthase
MKYLGAMALCAIAAAATAQSRSDAAAIREAVRFERAKAAAAQRQLGKESTHPAQPAKTQESVADAVAFERAKDAAAARQVRLDAHSSADRSVRLK